MLTESQLAALEKAKSEKEAHGEFESECPGYSGAQDTFYVGNMKGVGRIYSRPSSTPTPRSPSPSSMIARRRSPPPISSTIASCPSYDAHEVKLCRVLTDHGTESAAIPSIMDVSSTGARGCRSLATKTKSPQTNGIVERFHKTVLDEFYRVAFRKKIYGSIGELQSDLDDWVKN